jgi:hypothetical protein
MMKLCLLRNVLQRNARLEACVSAYVRMARIANHQVSMSMTACVNKKLWFLCIDVPVYSRMCYGALRTCHLAQTREQWRSVCF